MLADLLGHNTAACHRIRDIINQPNSDSLKAPLPYFEHSSSVTLTPCIRRSLERRKCVEDPLFFGSGGLVLGGHESSKHHACHEFLVLRIQKCSATFVFTA